jgi:hypothetical protein
MRWNHRLDSCGRFTKQSWSKVRGKFCWAYQKGFLWFPQFLLGQSPCPVCYLFSKGLRITRCCGCFPSMLNCAKCSTKNLDCRASGAWHQTGRLEELNQLNILDTTQIDGFIENMTNVMVHVWPVSKWWHIILRHFRMYLHALVVQTIFIPFLPRISANPFPVMCENAICVAPSSP